MLETRIEELTAAVKELTAVIGRMQAPGPDSILHELKSAPITNKAPKEETRGGLTHEEYQNARLPNAQSSTDTISGEQSAPTGESSSPALDYAKDVKPITIQLSKEKGREITVSVLSRFGVKSAQDLDPAQWAEYIAHCGKVLAGGEV
jgi:hypothetical protein